MNFQAVLAVLLCRITVMRKHLPVPSPAALALLWPAASLRLVEPVADENAPHFRRRTPLHSVLLEPSVPLPSTAGRAAAISSPVLPLPALLLPLLSAAVTAIPVTALRRRRPARHPAGTGHAVPLTHIRPQLLPSPVVRRLLAPGRAVRIFCHQVIKEICDESCLHRICLPHTPPVVPDEDSLDDLRRIV